MMKTTQSPLRLNELLGAAFHLTNLFTFRPFKLDP